MKVLEVNHYQCRECKQLIRHDPLMKDSEFAIVYCAHPYCSEHEKRYKLPLKIIELEPVK